MHYVERLGVKRKERNIEVQQSKWPCSHQNLSLPSDAGLSHRQNWYTCVWSPVAAHTILTGHLSSVQLSSVLSLSIFFSLLSHHFSFPESTLILHFWQNSDTVIQWCTLPRLSTKNTTSLQQPAYSSPDLVTQSFTITPAFWGQSSGQQSTSTYFCARQIQFLIFYSQDDCTVEKSSLKPKLKWWCKLAIPALQRFKCSRQPSLLRDSFQRNRTNNKVHSTWCISA